MTEEQYYNPVVPAHVESGVWDRTLHADRIPVLKQYSDVVRHVGTLERIREEIAYYLAIAREIESMARTVPRGHVR